MPQRITVDLADPAAIAHVLEYLRAQGHAARVEDLEETHVALAETPGEGASA